MSVLETSPRTTSTLWRSIRRMSAGEDLVGVRLVVLGDDHDGPAEDAPAVVGLGDGQANALSVSSPKAAFGPDIEPNGPASPAARPRGPRQQQATAAPRSHHRRPPSACEAPPPFRRLTTRVSPRSPQAVGLDTRDRPVPSAGSVPHGTSTESAPGADALMAKIDHHLHTSRHSPDSIIDPEELIVQARSAGLDGVVITEHDYQWGPDELAELNRRSGGLLVLSRGGGLDPRGPLPRLRPARPGRGRRRGSAGRPDRRGPPPRRGDRRGPPVPLGPGLPPIVAELGPAFDALELVSNNVTPETRRRTAALLAEAPHGGHRLERRPRPEVVGCYYTEFPGPIAHLADFVAALNRRDGRPRHRQGARQAAGPVEEGDLVGRSA